jgi:hypothetical protein
MTPENLNQFKEETRYLEDDNKFIHDKLIALTTAIMGFTIVMFGDDKLSKINHCALKISWVSLGTYLLFSISTLWASLRYKAINMARTAFINLDEIDLQYERDPDKKKEKTVLLQILKCREFFVKGFKSQSRKKRKSDPYFQATKSFFSKYKDELHVTRYLKNDVEFDTLSFRDRLMMFCISNGEWSYIFFGIGMLALLASVFF